METRLETLLWLSEETRESIQEAPADRRAPLIAQMRGIAAEIAEISKDSGKARDPIDEIAARRTARGGTTARAGRAERSS